MNINFSNEEMIYLYCHFRKEIKKLEDLKSLPNCPISKINLNQDIKLFSGIADKLRDACPELSGLDNYKF